jgi:predicted nucleic acid-binding protein
VTLRRFVDTSALIGAFYEDNPYHDACLVLFAELRPANDACGAHSLAEIYSSLTRMPPSKRVHPDQAGIFLQHVQSRMQTVALTAEEYAREIRLAVENRVVGGQVYDALLIACARKHAADRIYTLNLKHFRRLAPDLADRIVTP